MTGRRVCSKGRRQMWPSPGPQVSDTRFLKSGCWMAYGESLFAGIFDELISGTAAVVANIAYHPRSLWFKFMSPGCVFHSPNLPEPNPSDSAQAETSKASAPAEEKRLRALQRWLMQLVTSAFRRPRPSGLEFSKAGGF